MEGFQNGMKPYKIYTVDESIVHVAVSLMLFIDRPLNAAGYKNNSELVRYCGRLKEKCNFEYIKRLREKD